MKLMRSLKGMEELKKFQSSTFDTIARRRLVEDQDSILELTGKIQELQNETNCMSDSKEFQDAESVRSGHSHVTSQPVSFPPHPIPGGIFKTEVCTCSQFPTEAMHWIKEVEMVDSVDDLKSSSSVRGIRMPDFEALDARIASALNRIIHNSQL